MACLIPVWTDMGVDPMAVELVHESVDFSHEVRCGDNVVGTLVIEDIDAVVEPNYGIAEQVTLRAPRTNRTQAVKRHLTAACIACGEWSSGESAWSGEV